MVLSVTYTTGKGPKLDAQRFQNDMFVNYRYDTICQTK